MQHVEEELAHATQHGAKLIADHRAKATGARKGDAHVPWPMQRRCALCSPRCRTPPEGSPAVRMRLHRVVGASADGWLRCRRRTRLARSPRGSARCRAQTSPRPTGRCRRAWTAGRRARPCALAACTTPLVACTHDSALIPDTRHIGAPRHRSCCSRRGAGRLGGCCWPTSI